MAILLFISVLLIAACGLIYELVAGTLASYLLGDSILQFSTVIGTYLFAMGIGSALSRYLNRGLVYRFIWIELLLGVIGGFSSALLMLAFAFTQGFSIILYALVIVMGVLVGLEIPRRIVDFSDHPRSSTGPRPLRHALRPHQCRRRPLDHLHLRESARDNARTP